MQLTRNLGDSSGFVGICLFPFKLGSVLAPFVMESTRGIPQRFEEIERQYLSFVTTLNVTEGLMAPGVSDASLNRKKYLFYTLGPGRITRFPK